MNKFASITAAAALCATPLMVAHATSQSLQTKPAVLPMNGSYLSTAYLAVLEKTKSHKKAWAKASPNFHRRSSKRLSDWNGFWRLDQQLDYTLTELPNRPTNRDKLRRL